MTRASRRIVYTILADHQPVVAFLGAGHKEAQELIREGWFVDELRSKRSGGQLIWDGKAKLTARIALPNEQEQYAADAGADDASGDVTLVYLVPLD